MSRKKDNLIWIDLEMTGLNPKEHRIIEIATIVTDPQLEVLAEGPVLAIHQTKRMLDKMDEWNVTHHGRSGLIDRVKKSKVREAQAVEETLAFLCQYSSPNKSPMCGSSVCQDRRFLLRWMPELEKYFHYRNLDVSSIKELVKRWAPDIADGFKKKSEHIALKDIYDSITELKYYREHVFKI